MKRSIYPINANMFSKQQREDLGGMLIAYLHGIGEDDEVSGSDLVDHVFSIMDFIHNDKGYDKK
jgi:hypothetical protein